MQLKDMSLVLPLVAVQVRKVSKYDNYTFVQTEKTPKNMKMKTCKICSGVTTSKN